MTENVLSFMKLSLPLYIQRMIAGGYFKAGNEIRELLSKVSGDYKSRLEFELERLRRWPIQHPYKEKTYAQAVKKGKDLSRGELEPN